MPSTTSWYKNSATQKSTLTWYAHSLSQRPDCGFWKPSSLVFWCGNPRDRYCLILPKTNPSICSLNSFSSYLWKGPFSKKQGTVSKAAESFREISHKKCPCLWNLANLVFILIFGLFLLKIFCCLLLTQAVPMGLSLCSVLIVLTVHGQFINSYCPPQMPLFEGQVCVLSTYWIFLHWLFSMYLQLNVQI